MRFYLINLPKGSFLITFPCAAVQELELPHTEKVPHSGFTPKILGVVCEQLKCADYTPENTQTW